MSELSEAIARILRREGADQTMILGARLGALVREEHGDLLIAEMARQGVRFVQLVEQTPGVRVIRDAGTGADVLIGFEGALPPAPSEGRPLLRSDVYAAFTRFGNDYWYDPGTDEFRQGLPNEGGVACPKVRQSDPAEMRKEFAEQVGEPHRSELLSTLDGQEGSLSRFREAIALARLTADWERFRHEVLSKDIREWSSSHDLEIQAAWFHHRGATQRRHSGPRQLLSDLVGVMNDEEARSIPVPLSAVERYLSRRQQDPSG